MKGTNQLFHHKILLEADKIQPFSSDLYPSEYFEEKVIFSPLIWEIFGIPRKTWYTEASGHTDYGHCWWVESI